MHALDLIAERIAEKIAHQVVMDTLDNERSQVGNDAPKHLELSTEEDYVCHMEKTQNEIRLAAIAASKATREGVTRNAITFHSMDEAKEWSKKLLAVGLSHSWMGGNIAGFHTTWSVTP